MACVSYWASNWTPSHSSDNVRSLTPCTSRGTPKFRICASKDTIKKMKTVHRTGKLQIIFDKRLVSRIHKELLRKSCCGSVVTNPTSIQEDTSSTPGPTQWVKSSSTAVSCGVGCRCSLDPVLLWLWRKPGAASQIRHLAREFPNATGVALKNKDKKKKQKQKQNKKTS